MPQPDYLNACLAARRAAAQNRKATWSIFSMTHINCLLSGLGTLKYTHSYNIARLIAAVECYSFGVMGQSSLTYENFNLAIGPVASVLIPELFAEQQTWTIEPLVETNYSRPYRPASYRFRKTKKEISLNEGDLAGLVDKMVQEAVQKTPAVAQAPIRVEDTQANAEAKIEAMRKAGWPV